MITLHRNVPKILQRSLAKRSGDLTMLPALATEALKMTRDPDCTAGRFASLIAQDVVLASETLTLANSPLFSAGPQVSSLKKAVVRLGLKQCRNLVLSCSVSSLMKQMPVQHEWVRKVIWDHSHRTAMTCNYLNHRLRLGYDGEEIAAGLLHDFGRLLLSIAAPDDAADADDLSFNDEEDQLSQERSVLGVDHCAFGAWFAAKQGLPEDLVAAIEHHHDPHTYHPASKLIALVAASDHIANHFQRYEELGDYDIAENAGAHALADLGFTGLLENEDEVCETVFNTVLAGDQAPA